MPEFDAVAIAATVEELRSPYPVAARLIEDLWAEVQRARQPDFTGLPREMTKKERDGPFLGKSEVDVEFFDDDGNTCATRTAGLQILINDNGLMIISETRVGFKAERPLKVCGYRVWFGSDMLETVIAPVPLIAGEQYMLSLNMPIKLGRDIDHNPRGDDGPPRPMPPDPSNSTVKGDA